MLRELIQKPRRILMTLDAVGGVWRYAMDLAGGLAAQDIEVVFAGFGPAPSSRQRSEAERIGELVWLDLPLDWLAGAPDELAAIPAAIARLAKQHSVDLLHLNLPTQAAGLHAPCPVVVVSHSCVTTWFRAVRNADLPADWAWQRDLNARGLAAADIVIAPSRIHGEALEACYGTLPRLRIVHNAVRPIDCRRKLPLVLAAGRWWDEGKNAATLDRAAAGTRWPVLMAGATAGPNGERFEIANARPLGQLSRRRLAGWMARAAILASPSVYEPFGLVALEAASAGAALVLADIPTYRELWTDAAVFVPPRDASAWAEAIGRLASDDSHRAMLAARAWERASKLTVEAQAAATMTAYAEALFSPSHRRRAA